MECDDDIDTTAHKEKRNKPKRKSVQKSAQLMINMDISGTTMGVKALLLPILQQALGQSEVNEHYFPAALFVEDGTEQSPQGLDTAHQFTSTTWQEIFLRFTPYAGTFFVGPQVGGDAH